MTVIRPRMVAHNHVVYNYGWFATVHWVFSKILGTVVALNDA